MNSIDAVNNSAIADKNVETAASVSPNLSALLLSAQAGASLFPAAQVSGLSQTSGTQLFGNGSLQTRPFPFSQLTATVSDPTQFTDNLSSASDKLLAGINSGQLGSFDAGAIDQQVANLQNQAAQDAASGNVLKAQQEMTQASILEQLASQLMNSFGSQAKQSIQNWSF
jgi:hypothetical protein